MKTVRLSEQLKRDILKNAEEKFNNANPMKEFPQDGYAVLQRLGIMDKTNRSKQVFKEIWGQDMPMREIDNIRLIAEQAPVDTDDDGEGNTYFPDSYAGRTLEFAIPCTPTKVPRFMANYDTIEYEVPPTDETIVECMTIRNFNDERDTKKREYRNKLDSVMDRFSTLNQLLKAAPYIKDLVPQEKLTKMYEKDDRSARRKELAEVADNELQDLREVLLEDALLGDDDK
jgi:hypothetical protein